jgi:hypothetical protein
MDLSLWKIPEFAGEEESCIGVRAAGGLGERGRPGSPPGLGTRAQGVNRKGRSRICGLFNPCPTLRR